MSQRKVADLLDFSFVYGLFKDLYAHEEGRPSIDPVSLVKLTLIQKLIGHSDRTLGLGASQNRRSRKLQGTG